ncbi:MAG: phosphohydrolase, partial [Syntrophothermus sp.]
YSDVSIDEYIKENMVGGTANGRIKEMSKHAPNLEFEIKWKSGPDRLYTSKGKEIARKRIGFMELFFQKLKKEVDGEI